MLFSIVSASFYILANSVQSLHILANTVIVYILFLFIVANVMGVKEYFIEVLISLMISDVGYLCMCLLAICIPLEKYGSTQQCFRDLPRNCLMSKWFRVLTAAILP